MIGGTHIFHTAIAMKIGIEAAIILENIFFWCKKNEANEKHYHHGKTWTYNSIEAFHKLFPYMSKYSIRKALIDLEKYGYIITGNFNKVSYDQTKWYAITDKVLEDFNEKSEQIDSKKIENSIYRKLKMDSSKTENGILILDKAIPDSKLISKTSDNKLLKDSRKNSFAERVVSLWNVVAEDNQLSSISKLSPSRINKILSRSKSSDLSKLSGWRKLFSKVTESTFLLGTSNSASTWKVSFDWLIENDKNYLKVLEGAYPNDKKKPRTRPGGAEMEEGKYDNTPGKYFDNVTGKWYRTVGEKVMEEII